MKLKKKPNGKYSFLKKEKMNTKEEKSETPAQQAIELRLKKEMKGK